AADATGVDMTEIDRAVQARTVDANQSAFIELIDGQSLAHHADTAGGECAVVDGDDNLTAAVASGHIYIAGNGDFLSGHTQESAAAAQGSGCNRSHSIGKGGGNVYCR